MKISVAEGLEKLEQSGKLFENFTDYFATCVIFYGPQGGEKNI